MPLPIEACAADVPTQVCCSTLWDIAERMRVVCCAAIEECMDPSCADREFRSYVAHGPEVEEPLGDALVVVLAETAITYGRAPGQDGPPGVDGTRYEVRLYENGWPTIRANEAGEIVEVPDTDLIHRLSRHSYGHGEKLYRTVRNGVQTGSLFPPATFAHVGKGSNLAMRPLRPEGYMVGWAVRLDIQVTFPPETS